RLRGGSAVELDADLATARLEAPGPQAVLGELEGRHEVVRGLLGLRGLGRRGLCGRLGVGRRVGIRAAATQRDRRRHPEAHDERADDDEADRALSTTSTLLRGARCLALRLAAARS